ncbi:hypothetical protein EYF80_042403 [Liparis tanakae]|uniref:Uncharacterized protein n=1 Tax=Liparis tanakae TaxID=230148 RepID=A0A4Z2G2M0_9TELE|nr:hypothetical protein EYF80_042403 [Liparis tanakae]
MLDTACIRVEDKLQLQSVCAGVRVPLQQLQLGCVDLRQADALGLHLQPALALPTGRKHRRALLQHEELGGVALLAVGGLLPVVRAETLHLLCVTLLQLQLLLLLLRLQPLELHGEGGGRRAWARNSPAQVRELLLAAALQFIVSHLQLRHLGGRQSYVAAENMQMRQMRQMRQLCCDVPPPLALRRQKQKHQYEKDDSVCEETERRV